MVVLIFFYSSEKTKVLHALVDPLWSLFEQGVVRVCTANLSTNVETIARNYRFHNTSAMSSKTSKTNATEPSPYIEVLVATLTVHVPDQADMDPHSALDETVVVRVVGEISTRYRTAVASMLEGARKTEQSLQRMKKTAGNIAQMAGQSNRLGSAASSSGGLSKILEQVACDIGFYVDKTKGMLGKATCAELASLEAWLKGGLV